MKEIAVPEKTELDFYAHRNALSCFGTVKNSKKIRAFQQVDSAKKLSPQHKHYYFCTYDSVFEVVASSYELNFLGSYY